MTDDKSGGKQPKRQAFYLNGAAVTNEALMTELIALGEDLKDQERRIDDMGDTLLQIEKNTSRMADNTEGLKWRIPMSAHLATVGAIVVVFVLFAVGVLKTDFHLTSTSIQARPYSPHAPYSPAEKPSGAN